MSIHLLECAATQQLPASTKLALMAFADSADRRTHIALPGLEQVMAWSGLGRSQAMQVVRDLAELGLLSKHRAGRRGHRAEYVVFPFGCCPEHMRPAADAEVTDDTSSTDLGSGQPDSVSVNGSGQPDPNQGLAVEPVDNAEVGSGQSDPKSAIGSGLGPAHRTPSLTTNNPPIPPNTGGDSCGKHPNGDGPNCRACGTSPKQLAAARRRAAADRRRAAETERSRLEAEAATQRRRPPAVDPVSRSHLAEAKAKVAAARELATSGGAR